MQIKINTAVLKWIPLVKKVLKNNPELKEIHPAFVMAIIQRESNGRAEAFRYEDGYYHRQIENNPTWRKMMESHKWTAKDVSSSYGLMQVMYPTGVGIGFMREPKAFFDPEYNITCGCTYIARLSKKYKGNLGEVAAHYNAGGAGVKDLREGVQSRGVIYSKEVLGLMKLYEEKI